MKTMIIKKECKVNRKIRNERNENYLNLVIKKEIKTKSKNLDEMEACMEGAISQGAGDYFRTIHKLQVPIPQQN